MWTVAHSVHDGVCVVQFNIEQFIILHYLINMGQCNIIYNPIEVLGSITFNIYNRVQWNSANTIHRMGQHVHYTIVWVSGMYS